MRSLARTPSRSSNLSSSEMLRFEVVSFGTRGGEECRHGDVDADLPANLRRLGRGAAPASTCSGGFRASAPGRLSPRSRAARCDPADVPKFETPMLIPPVMPRAGTIRQRGGKHVDYYEISMRQFAQQILPGGPAGDDGLGLRRDGGAEQARAADPQRPVADDRGEVEPAGPGQVDQRARGRQRQLPAAPASGRPDAALGEPAGRHGGPRHAGRRSPRRPAPTRARCRSSPTSTAPSASATRATATPRRGTCPPRTTSRRATRPRAPGTTSSPARPRRAYGVDVGARVRHLPVPERRTARRRSGTTTTRSA